MVDETEQVSHRPSIGGQPVWCTSDLGASFDLGALITVIDEDYSDGQLGKVVHLREDGFQLWVLAGIVMLVTERWCGLLEP